MISVSGTGGAGMRAFAGRLRGAVADAPRGEAAEVQPELESLVDSGFLFARAPDGSRWKQRKRPTGAWPLLVKTNVMLLGRRVLKGSGNLVMSLPAPAQFHQGGTEFMEPRKILPVNTLPPSWAARVGAARVRWWRERLGVS
jgi:hypothetical protein